MVNYEEFEERNAPFYTAWAVYDHPGLFTYEMCVLGNPRPLGFFNTMEEAEAKAQQESARFGVGSAYAKVTEPGQEIYYTRADGSGGIVGQHVTGVGLSPLPTPDDPGVVPTTPGSSGSNGMGVGSIALIGLLAWVLTKKRRS